MKKIIIDTDPGIDDALAICYAMKHPQLQVLALTCIYGNVSTSLATDNALRLCELCESSAIVAKGATQPLSITPHPVADFVHGKNGFGNAELPASERTPCAESAAELIVRLINENPGEISLVAVGPLTNIALALELSPDITNKVADVVIMGGTFYREGNVSLHAEANIWNDPHAAKQVFNASWPLVVHGLDVTRKITFSRAYLDHIAVNSPVPGNFLRQASEFYIDFYESRQAIKGCCPHDHLALAYVTHPEWFILESGNLDVVTEGEQIGRTTITKDQPDGANKDINAESGSALRQIAVDVNATELLRDYSEVLTAPTT
jgi:inosine-uridine nucleoside N-ribohydrolase